MSTIPLLQSYCEGNGPRLREFTLILSAGSKLGGWNTVEGSLLLRRTREVLEKGILGWESDTWPRHVRGGQRGLIKPFSKLPLRFVSVVHSD